MSFQAGLFCLDDQEILRSEAEAILSGVAYTDCNRPTGLRSPGVFLAYADSRLDDRIPDVPQPYAAAAGAITFDGRLDNREDLLLRLRDALRVNTSDTALALAAYGRWGAEGLVHLIGDWSLVIWDAAGKAVVLASDFAGVRPLYYCVRRNRLFWSTRLSAVVDWADAGEIDDEYVAGLLMCVGCPNHTPYRGVY